MHCNDSCAAEACNTNACPARLKRCPGLTAVTDPVSNATSLVPCSTFGTCKRSVPTCAEDDASCTAVCLCATNRTGSDCSYTPAQLAAKQALRTQLLSALVRVIPLGEGVTRVCRRLHVVCSACTFPSTGGVGGLMGCPCICLLPGAADVGIPVDAAVQCGRGTAGSVHLVPAVDQS